MNIAKRIGEDLRGATVGYNPTKLTKEEKERLGKQFKKDSLILGIAGGLILTLAVVLLCIDGLWGDAILFGTVGLILGGFIWYLSRL
jgi:hypothetical protein